MVQRATILLLFLSLGLSAEKLTLDFFKDKPRSFAKDFYISLFLDQNISPKEARELIGEVNNMNFRLFYKFADKMDDFSFKRVKYCKKLAPEKYKGKSADCIAMGLTPYKATKLKPNSLVDIAKSINYQYPEISQSYRLISSKSFQMLMDADDKILINTFTSVGSRFRKEYYNDHIPPTKVNSLAKQISFSTMVEKIVREKDLNKLQQSILKFDSSKLTAKANFLLALNAIRLKREDIAIWYLKLAEKKAVSAFAKTKAIFWQYLITKDKALLTKMCESKDINIYTLYAYQTLGKEPTGIKLSLEPKIDKAPFDIKDPFAWIDIKNRFKEQKFNSYESKRLAALKLNSEDTEPHVTRLIYNFKLNEHYFLIPYKRYLAGLKRERIALILSIAKQESHFIPTSVSYSYALGMMQFMPFVAKDIAKKNGFVNFRYEDLFDPKFAYKFADIHLDYLEKSLYHPLFIAYAYNGGLGFTKRSILQKDYFKDGKYEPFMSLEMVPNAQARHYGKKVLANYAIYAKLLGVDTDIKTLFETLKPPHRMHRF